MASMLSIPYHQQNTNEFCGAACAQMVLTALGQDVGALNQAALYTTANTTTSGTTGWYSYPDGLVNTLNAEWGDAQGLRFLLYICDTKDDLLQTVRQTIENTAGHQAGPIVVTGMKDHWVVVKGVELDPAASVGGVTPIIGLHLNNPLPARGAAADWPHAETDGCGTGQNYDWLCYYVSITYWNSKMMRGVRTRGPWRKKFLAICLSPNPGTGINRVTVPATGAGSGANDSPPSGPARTPAQIGESVEDLTAGSPFAGIECLTLAMEGATPGAPIFVHGLSEDGSEDPSEDYYIVPFLREGDVIDPDSKERSGPRVPLLLTFDAHTGEFEEAVAVPEGTTYDATWLDPEFVAVRSERALVRQRESDRSGSAFPFRLVWRPSFETPTRFWPLLEGERQRSDNGVEPVYTRIDGEVLTELTPLHG